MRHDLLQFFAYAHLPPRLQVASEPFGAVADAIDGEPSSIVVGAALQRRVEALQLRLGSLPDNAESREAQSKLNRLRSMLHAFPNGEGGVSKSYALRELLEAKDCAVRAVLFKPAVEEGQSA